MGRWHVILRVGATDSPAPFTGGNRLTATAPVGGPPGAADPGSVLALQPVEGPLLPSSVPRLPVGARLEPRRPGSPGPPCVPAPPAVSPPATDLEDEEESATATSWRSFPTLSSVSTVSEVGSLPDLADFLPASPPPPAEDVDEDPLPDLRDLSPLLVAASESPTPEAVPPPWAPLRDDDSGSEHGSPTVDLSALRSPSPSGRFLDRFRRLTTADLQAMAADAAALQAAPRDDPAAAEQEAPPAVASGPPDQEDQDDQQDDDEDDPEDDDESPLSFVRGRRSVSASPDHEVDVPERPSLSPAIAADHRVQSILTRGATTYIPPGARGQFHITPVTTVTSNIVNALTKSRILVPGKVRNAYRLFALAKDARRARVLYDLSPLTPHLEPPPCFLPRALDLLKDTEAAWAIKLDLSHGFYHVPLHPHLQQFMGVRMGDGREFRWTVLPMGLASAPALMQTVMTAVVKFVQRRHAGITGYVYLDDFLFLAPRPELLRGIADTFREVGLHINTDKSHLEPTQTLRYLGLEMDLNTRHISVPGPLRKRVLRAIARSPELTFHQAQQLAGFVNFLRPIAKLPLQLVSAILQRLPDLPGWVRDGVWDHDWSFSCEDYHNWFRQHSLSWAVDATPRQLGVVTPLQAISIPLAESRPIYIAEYIAALIAATAAPPATTIFTDNKGTLYNIHKGRCPFSWLPFVSAFFASRAQSFRYVPSALNPADGPSRWPTHTPEHS